MSASGADRFAGRVALVTGAASGIGRATALLFAGQGARVIASDEASYVTACVLPIDAGYTA